MALNKEKMTDYGIKASYWRLDNLSIDKANKEGGFTLKLYTSKEATAPLDYYVVALTADKYGEDGAGSTERFDKYFGTEVSSYENIYAACYACAKETEEFFKDAVDC